MDNSTTYTLHKLAVAMDREAERTLQAGLSLSYGRFYFLFVLAESGTLTQHALATALGRSDPAISNMTSELAGEGLISVSIDPSHQRRRLLSITDAGQQLVNNGTRLLDECFHRLVEEVDIDEKHYKKQTEKLINGLELRQRKEH